MPFDPRRTLAIQDQEELPTTTVNGSDFGATFSGVTGSIIVRLHGGGDKVNIRLLQIGGDLVVEGGSGADQIHVGRFLTVDSTDFNESAAQDQVVVSGNVRIAAGDHGDTVRMIRTAVTGDVEVTSDDVLHVDFTNTTMRALSVVTAAGADRITSFNVSADTIQIATGAGDDVVMLDAEVETSATIDLGAGTDLLRQRGSVAIGDLTIDAGPGADQVILGGTPGSGDDATYYWWFVSTDPLLEMGRGAAGSLFVNGNLTVSTHGGDYLNLQYAWIAESLRIDSGQTATPEFIRLRNVAAREVIVIADAGDDVINVSFATAEKVLGITLGDGNDVLSMHVVAYNNSTILHDDVILGAGFSGGEGRDTLAFDGCRFDGLAEFDGGNGDDHLLLTRSLVNHSSIWTDGGRDRVEIAFSAISSLSTATGEDDDQVFVRTCAIDEVFFDLGEGSDLLDIDGCVLRAIGDADGGAGFDMLNRRNSRIKQFNARNFEAGNDAGLVLV
jgi:hypothetical protein